MTFLYNNNSISASVGYLARRPHQLAIKKAHLLPIGNLYDFAPAARAVIWLPMQIPNTGSGRLLARTFSGRKIHTNLYENCYRTNIKIYM